MSAKPGKLGGFDPFAGATPPTSPAADGQQPAQTPAATRPATTGPERPAKPAPARQRADTAPQSPAPARPELSKAEQRRILHRVRAAAGKVAADRARLDESEEAYAYEVADARRRGMDERLLLGAALSAGVDLPPDASASE